MTAGTARVDVAVGRRGGHKVLLVVNKGSTNGTGSIDVWNLRTMQHTARVGVELHRTRHALVTRFQRRLALGRALAPPEPA